MYIIFRTCKFAVHVICSACGCHGPISALTYKQAETPRLPFTHHRRHQPAARTPAIQLSPQSINTAARPPRPRPCANQSYHDIPQIALPPRRAPSLAATPPPPLLPTIPRLRNRILNNLRPAPRHAASAATNRVPSQPPADLGGWRVLSR